MTCWKRGKSSKYGQTSKLKAFQGPMLKLRLFLRLVQLAGLDLFQTFLNVFYALLLCLFGRLFLWQTVWKTDIGPTVNLSTSCFSNCRLYYRFSDSDFFTFFFKNICYPTQDTRSVIHIKYLYQMLSNNMPFDVTYLVL